MVKLYSRNGQTIVERDNKIKIIEADFRINSDINVLDIVNETKPGQVWAVRFQDLQDENGNPIGTDLQDVITYVSKMTVSSSNVTLGGANVDAFNRLRTSELTTQIDIKQIHGNSDLFIDKVNINGGAFVYDPNDSSSEISVSANGDKVIHQTKQRFNYQSGKSQLIISTAYNFNSVSGVIKRMGYFSSSTVSPYSANLDGFFIQSDETGISINIYKNGTLINQTYSNSWNGIKLDNQTFENDFILYCDFEWLGVGIVRWGLVEMGEIKYFHVSRHDNTLKGVYMTSPNQPLRWEIESTGGASSFNYVCAQVASEGSINKVGKILSEDMGITHVNANTAGTIYALMGIRLKTENLDSFIDVLNWTCLGLTNDSFLYRWYLNPTVDGTFSYIDIDESTVQIAKGASNGSNVVTSGTPLKMDAGYFYQRTTREVSIENSIRLGAKIDGTPDEFVLCVIPISNGLDVLASLRWRELS